MITIYRIRYSRKMYLNTKKYNRQVTTMKAYRTEQLRKETGLVKAGAA